MPNLIEQQQEQMCKFDKWFFGDITKLNEPLTWFQKYVTLPLKIIPLPIAIVTYILTLKGMDLYFWSLFFYVAFLFDFAMFIYTNKRYNNYLEYLKYKKMCKIPKGRHG